MKCVSYTRTLPWKNHQSKLTIAEQNQRIAAYLAEHKELDLQKKYSDRKNDEKARAAFDQMTNDGVERKFDCIIVASIGKPTKMVSYSSMLSRLAAMAGREVGSLISMVLRDFLSIQFKSALV